MKLLRVSTWLIRVANNFMKRNYGAFYVWRIFNPSSYPDAYIPILNGLCRCAYVMETLIFGRVDDTVTVVVPINNFAGF